MISSCDLCFLFSTISLSLYYLYLTSKALDWCRLTWGKNGNWLSQIYKKVKNNIKWYGKSVVKSFGRSIFFGNTISYYAFQNLANKTRKCHNHRLQTSTWNHGEETQSTKATTQSITTSSLFLSKMIAKLEGQEPHHKTRIQHKAPHTMGAITNNE